MDEEDDELVNDTLFHDDHGKPLKFYLHPSIKQPGARLALEAKIELHGGEINPVKSGSNIILVNPKDPSGNVDELRHLYKTHSDPSLKGVHVETMRWVELSVKLGKCVHLFTQKRMGGVAAGGFRERTDFSEEDDRRICEYVGQLIPDKSNGGRTGNNIYKRLIRNAEIEPEEYNWAFRHTWQSWRERYKKNQGRLDAYIDAWVVPLGVEPHQMYHLSRNAPRTSHREEEEEEEENEEEDAEVEEEDAEVENEIDNEIDVAPPSQKRRVSGSSSTQRDAKRQRRSLSLPDVEVEVGRSLAKAKEATPPYDDDGDGYLSDQSLFGPDPEPSQHTPPPPIEARLPTPHIRSSQATLVGTAPMRETSLSKSTVPRPSAVPVAPRKAVEPAIVQESPPRRQEPSPRRQEPPPRRQESPPLRQESPPRRQESPRRRQESPRRRQESPPRHQQPARARLAARPAIPRPPRRKPTPAPVPETVEPQTPYRLRSRSKSVEPAAYEDPNAIMRKNRQKGKKRDLEAVEEEESRASREAVEEEEPRAGGTVETQEEQNVQDLLMATSAISALDGGNAFEEEVVSNPPPRDIRPQRIARRRPSELEPDDRQTDLALRRRQVSFSPASNRRSSVTRTLSEVGEVLRQLREPRLSRPPERVATSKAGSSPRYVQNFPPDSAFSRHAAPSVDLHNPLYMQSAPGRASSRKDSPESFPIPHTRASAFKRDVMTSEKHTPYRPPAGTRAAALSK
ncbi:hypothetical protein B0H17DRAFT_1028340 [Mycena rosella]|uniref:DNA-binding protein RAP1 n=1 Tax=Mycena rosella TaxID=1033263 RepID=A0AAD7H0L5_MYCRO|nr:hypothetical protein B0H17DRAFT_1028340 [Mycena rosella]